jgi:ATP-dependent RNA helicase RhlE
LQTFSEIGLCEPIQKALLAEGYTTPTPIQQQSIPSVMAGRDLCGIAQTGTGKTAAFALPILNRLAADKAARRPRACRALVLSPTRELASQIAASFRAYGRGLDLKTAVIFGGVSQGRQAQELARGVDILVATPGRLLDLVDQRLLTLTDVEVLVLDEADQMLDLGFIVPLRRIVKLLPKDRQTLFFSATMPRTIADLAADLLRDPVQVAVKPVATTAERVEQSVIFVAQGQKPALLASLLADPAMQRVLVFTRTKHGADKVVRGLDKTGVRAQAIHGNKSQGQRERALAAFKAGDVRVLVATDIAARGIHVEGVTHVVNFDLPNVPESYVHRIGRTARAGAAGVAISFCNGEERAYLRDIEKLTRAKVPVAALPSGLAPTETVSQPEPRREPNRRSRGQHPAGGQRHQPGAANRHQPASGKRKAHRPRPERNASENRERRSGSRFPGLDERGLPAFLTRPQRRSGGG